MTSRVEVSLVAADEAGAAGDGDGVAWSRGLQFAEVGEVGVQGVIGLACDVALQAADDLALGFALTGASGGVGLGAGAVAQATDGDRVQGAVGVAVTAIVQPVARGASGGRGDRAGAAERGERAVAVQAFDVLASGTSSCPA
jgi:hypothetical protein